MWDLHLNFRLLIILFITSGCGVKAIPKMEKNQAIDRYIQEQSPELQPELQKDEEAKKKNAPSKTATEKAK